MDKRVWAHAVSAACAAFFLGIAAFACVACAASPHPGVDDGAGGSSGDPVGTAIPVPTLPKSLSLDDLRGMSATPVQVRDETSDGRAREVAGAFPDLVVTDADTALSALLSLRDVFAIDSYDYELVAHDENRSEFDVLTLRQLHRGVPVETGVFTIATDKDGAMRSIGGAYIDVEDVDVTPDVSSDDALSAAVLEAGERPEATDLMIASDGNGEGLALVWHIRIAGRTQASDRAVYIDAHTGMVLRQEPLSIS